MMHKTPLGAVSSSDARWRQPSFRRRLLFQELGVVVAGIVIAIIFEAASPNFLTIDSVASILAAAVQFGIVGLGVTFLLIAGEFDLSVGPVYALVPLVMAWLFVQHQVNAWIAFGLALLFAIGIGLLNGLLTVLLNIPSFIVTLAAALFWEGVSLNLTGGYPISYFGHEHLMNWLGAAQIGRTGISVAVFWLVATGLLFSVILRQTRFGNWVYASGGDPLAARAMGVPVKRVKLINFAVASLLAGLTGIIQFGSLGSATPTQGSDLALTAIVVAVVGGAALAGGRGSILGAMLGALVLGMSYTGLILMGVSSTWFTSFVGFVLLFAVIVNLRTGRLKARLGVIG